MSMTKEQIKDAIIAETRAMRGHQKAYFSTRDRAILQKSKDSERKVDSLFALLDQPKNLFS